jgi:LysR family transcriptional regulator, flagellar master operon regulator
MQMELIETFLDLVESRNFRLTSERLGITQSTVSSRVRTLEQALGSTLFLRGRTGASPTAAGVRFEEHARAIKASWGLARQELGALDRHDGALRIGCTVSLADTLLADWMDVILQTNPRAALHVEADYSPQMIDDLVFGALDLGVMYAPRYLPEIQFELLMTQRFVLVSSTARQSEEVELSDYIRATYTPALEKAHSELLPYLSRPRLSAGLDSIVIARLKRHGGSAYVPSHAVPDLAAAGIEAVPGFPLIEQPVYIAMHIRRRTNSLVRNAVKALRVLAATGKYGNQGEANQAV